MSKREHSLLRQFFAAAAVRAILALLLILGIGFVFSGGGAFHEWTTHRDMLREVAVYGMLACGMTLVIVTAGIDLSVSSVLALGSVCFATFAIHWQWPAYLSIPATLAIGALAGAVTGVLVAWFRLQPFIASLATMVFFRGLAKSLTGNLKISTYVQNEQGGFETLPMPAAFDWIDTRIFGGNIAVVTLLFLLCIAISWLLLSRLRLGRHLFAVGGSEEAARLSGVPVQRTLLLAYVWSGLFAAMAGICQAAQERQGDPEAGMTYELNAIAIVVIGGTSLMGAAAASASP
jgi:ribose transport system permease protein